MIEGAIDLRLGSPCDPPPDLVIDAMASAADSLGPYGKSVGSPVFRQAAADWMRRRLDVEIDPDCLEWQNDVGEEDCRIHPMAAHWLQGDLNRQVRIETGLEHGVTLAQSAIFRQ